MEIKNTRDVEFNPTLNMLVYGEPGVGKTTFGATAPRPLIIDAEAGILSIRDKDLDIVQIRNFEDMRSLFKELKKPEVSAKYDTLVIDSITEIMKKIVDEVRGSKERPTLQDWGTIISKTEIMLRTLRDMPKNVIITALVAEEKDDNKIVKRPSVNGKSLPEMMCSFMDVVGYMDVEKVAEGSERRIWVQPHLNYYAKDRSGKLENPIVSPDFTEMLKMVFGDEPEKVEAEKSEDPVERATCARCGNDRADGTALCDTCSDDEGDTSSPKEKAETPPTAEEMAKKKADGMENPPENSGSDSETPVQTETPTT